MRELKFRMIAQKTGKILGYVDIYDLLRSGPSVLPDLVEAVLEGVKFEQYTGLKDKNGKKIYEGDIVASLTKSIEGVKPSFYSYLKGVVKYCEEDTRYYIYGSCERSDRETLEKVDHTDVDDFVGNYYELEVIGNIHENPELVGGEE